MSNDLVELYDDKRIRLAMAFLADGESGKEVTDKKHNEEDFIGRMNNALNDTKVNSRLGEWTCLDAWVYTDKKLEARNATLIFESSDKKTLVIGVAGTNFINRYDWFVEDFEINPMQAWSQDIVNPDYKGGSGTNGYVTNGSMIALQNTWNYENRNGVKLIDWLSTYTQTNEDLTSIDITGHSLGGAISPVLAQALSDHKGAWNNGRNISISTYIYAGPTPGDKQFVAYVERQLSGVFSFYNTLDVVPHSWNLKMINDIHDIYSQGSPQFIKPDSSYYGAIIRKAVTWAYNKSEASGHEFQRWSSEHESTFTGQLPPRSVNPDAKPIEHSIDMLEDLLKGDLLENDDARSNVWSICFPGIPQPGNKTLEMASLNGFLDYFAKFLVAIGGEHVGEYLNCCFTLNGTGPFSSVDTYDSDFGQALYSYIGGKSWVAASGIEVLNELFKEISE